MTGRDARQRSKDDEAAEAGAESSSGVPRGVPMGLFEWQTVIRRAQLPAGVLGTALLLATYANKNGGSIWPGEERLSRVLGVTPRAVRRHLETLRAERYINRVKKQQWRSGHRTSDEYQLTRPVDFHDRPDVLTPDEGYRTPGSGVLYPQLGETPDTHVRR